MTDPHTKERWLARLAVSVVCPVCAAHEGHSCTQEEPPEGCSDSTASAGRGSWTIPAHPARLQAARKKKFHAKKKAKV